ncbi:MAG: GWxTD domain-containing protein [Candidatus Aminicenantes bacterium]|nr:MAG: GWxTD domain-containing protein [Candidatus Aminicenantes bacterium]
MRQNKKNLLFFFLLLLSLNFCRLYMLERKLDEEDAEFLSLVRYIITKEEKKMYLEMPKSDRTNFKEEFWKERDTDPDTELNEFKTEYLDRINEANRLFTAGKPGWLTDRGRTLILLGPPVHKSFYPMGDIASGLARPTEIWHYPAVPVIFIDYGGIGDYEYYFLSLGHQQEVYENFLEAKKLPSEKKKGTFDYTIVLSPKDDQNVILIEVEKGYLWMREEEEKMVTTLDVELEVYSMDNKKIWEHKEEYTVTLSKKELDQTLLSTHTIEIGIDLSPGTYTILSRIKNLTDDIKRSKTKIIKIE